MYNQSFFGVADDNAQSVKPLAAFFIGHHLDGWLAVVVSAIFLMWYNRYY